MNSLVHPGIAVDAAIETGTPVVFEADHFAAVIAHATILEDPSLLALT